MGSSGNAKTYLVAVLAPVFLGFVVPWGLRVNREARSAAQLQFDSAAMSVSVAVEIVLIVLFAVAFVSSLLYLARRASARRMLTAASIVSLVSFAAFAVGQSIAAQLSPEGWLYYAAVQALMQVFPGLVPVFGYATAAVVSLSRKDCVGSNKP